MLNSSEIGRYQRDGFLSRLGLLSKNQAADCRRNFGQIERASSGTLVRFDWAHLFFAWAYELSTHPDLLDTVESLLGPEIVIWGSLITNKPPRSEYHFAWHQDSAFCKFIGSAPALTAWIALTESTLENGCLKVLPESQRSDLAHAADDSEFNILRQNQSVTAPVDLTKSENIVLRAGEMSIQDMALLHTSNANQSDSPRIGFIVRFSTPEVTATDYPIIHARGSRACRHLTIWDPPVSNDIERGLQGRDAMLETLGRIQNAPASDNCT